MEFKANDIRKHLENGVFKGYMNLQKFQEQSGIVGQADSAYWSLTSESFELWFGAGNFTFFDEQMMMKNKNSYEMNQIIAIFMDKFQRNKSFSFDLINLYKQSLDIILFYKDSSQIPLNSFFLNFDISKLIFNFKIQKVELLLDIISYYNNSAIISKFPFLRPTCPVLSS